MFQFFKFYLSALPSPPSVSLSEHQPVCFFFGLPFLATLPLEPLHQPFLVLGIFEIGSHELFAWVGFKLPSSWSLPTWVARIIGVSHWCPGLDFFYFKDNSCLFFWELGLELRAYTLIHSTSPFLWFFFQDRVLGTISLGWSGTEIFLSS
jgi:hypothetical protein